MPPRHHVRIKGTRVKDANTFEKKRIRNRCQKGLFPNWLSMTKATSMNEDKNGPRKATTINMPTWYVWSNLISDFMRYRRMEAPIRASLQLLTNQDRIIVTGMFAFNCTSRCAGKAASRRNHHERTGDNNNAAKRIEFGGQSVETG